MPYLLMQKPLGQYVVATETEPPKRDIFNVLHAYQDEHLAALPFGRYPLLHQGIRIPESLFPRSARITRSATKRPPHIVGFAFTGVSMAFRRLIEDHEPGVHQFREVPFYLRNGEPAPEPYFAMVVGSSIESYVDFERSTARNTLWPGGGRTVESLSPNYPVKVFVNEAVVASHHLWISREIGENITISDCLHDALCAAKIRGFDYIKLFTQ